MVLGRGPRAGLAGDSLPLASPLGITTASFEADEPEPNGQVPAPGVLSLMLLGLGVLLKGRMRSETAA